MQSAKGKIEVARLQSATFNFVPQNKVAVRAMSDDCIKISEKAISVPVLREGEKTSKKAISVLHNQIISATNKKQVLSSENICFCFLFCA